MDNNGINTDCESKEDTTADEKHAEEKSGDIPTPADIKISPTVPKRKNSVSCLGSDPKIIKRDINISTVENLSIHMESKDTNSHKLENYHLFTEINHHDEHCELEEQNDFDCIIKDDSTHSHELENDQQFSPEKKENGQCPMDSVDELSSEIEQQCVVQNEPKKDDHVRDGQQHEQLVFSSSASSYELKNNAESPSEGIINNKKSRVSYANGCIKKTANKGPRLPVYKKRYRSSNKKSRRKSGKKKHRAGRNQKRKWKPYSKLSLSEREKVDARNERKNNRWREEMSAGGLSLAPLNTTQFICNDHLDTRINNDDPRYSDRPEGDFEEMWSYEYFKLKEKCSVPELVETFMELEADIERLEKERNEQELLIRQEFSDENELTELQRKIEVFKHEIKKLEEENEELLQNKECLVKSIALLKSSRQDENHESRDCSPLIS